MPRALITGIGGFVGPYLATHLLSRDYEVVGTSLADDPVGGPGPAVVALDIRQAEAVAELVRDVHPDAIFHLAGVTHPALALTRAFYDVNLTGTVNVLEAARAVDAEVLVVSSAYVYGRHDRAITEDAPLAPVNHYGASKAAADLAAIAYAREGLRIIRARAFNHTGPGQSPDFLLPTLVRQVARIEAGLEPPILRLGNLDSVRDFSDVRDVVQAYALLLERGESGEAYNVASGSGVSVRELAGMIVGLSTARVRVEVEPARVRADDIPYLVGDASKLRAATGWRPAHDLERTLADMLELERRRLRG